MKIFLESYKITIVKSLDSVVEFHGHICPGLAMGYRVSVFALRELGERAADEELVAVVENDSCAVDAVQAVTGCTFGKGNLIFRDYGKHVYTFVRRPGGDALRVSVNWTAPEETGEEKAAWRKYMAGDRSREVLRAVHDRKARKTDAILNAPDEELFEVRRLKVDLPPEARIHPSVTCSICGEQVMETRARVRDGKPVCMPCAEGG
ncbi:MAG: FmdE family protein [Thermodesulfovibrionales bacterium]